MPWKVRTTTEQKIEFICRWPTGKYSITGLCRSFEISRLTAYRLIDRFERLGFEGLKERSGSPQIHPNSTPDAIAESSLLHTAKHKLRGAKKIRIYWSCEGILCQTSAYDLKARPRRLMHFVKEYNHVQPHEALDM